MESGKWDANPSDGGGVVKVTLRTCTDELLKPKNSPLLWG